MDKQEKIFREYSVWRAIFTMALPVMLMMAVMILYNIADMFFVSQLGDTAKVAAVSIIGPVFALVMAVGNMIGGGGCALLARMLGEGRKDLVKRYSSLCCYGSLILGFIAAVLILICRAPLLKFLGANTDTYASAETYLCILAVGAPVMIFTAAFANILRSVGAVREGMIANLLGTAVNVVLDPVMILGLHMDVAGAAGATVIGNICAMLMIVILIYRKGYGLSLSLREAFSVRGQDEKKYGFLRDFGSIAAIGLPNLVSTGLSSFAGAFANNLLVSYGTAAVAAMAAAGKSTMVISMIQMGLCMGVQPLMAYSYGAGDRRRLSEVMKKLTILTVSLGSVLTLLCFTGSHVLIAIFIKEASAAALGEKMIRLLVISGPFFGLFYLGCNFLQASGNAPLAAFVSVLRQGLFLIPLLFIMNHFFGVTGNICANIVADIAASAVSVTLTLVQYRKLQKTDGRKNLQKNGKKVLSAADGICEN